MSFLAPWMLGAGIAAALGVVVLHLLTTRRPPLAILPTARFVPESDVRAVARASRPTDLLLLALRALAVLLVGAAFARPVPDAPGPRVRTVFAFDVSRSVADMDAFRAAVATRVGVGDTLVTFGNGEAVGTLSPMFVEARRAAAHIARGADSVRLLVVSPLGEGALDAATQSLRATWPGRVELERVRGVADTARSPRPELVTPLPDDPLAPALARLPANRGAHLVRIVRGELRSTDTSWARDGRRVLVHWPARVESPVALEGLAVFGRTGATIVAPLARGESPGGARIIARWSDGTPAGTESALGSGCIRRVAVGLPLAGDLTLRAPFVRALAALVEPCGGARGVALDTAGLEWLTVPGPLATGRALDDAGAVVTRLPWWLLLAAFALLVTESAVRRRRVATQEAA